MAVVERMQTRDELIKQILSLKQRGYKEYRVVEITGSTVLFVNDVWRGFVRRVRNKEVYGRTQSEIEAIREDRRTEVLKLVDAGVPKWNIGRKLNMSTHTVRKYIREREEQLKEELPNRLPYFRVVPRYLCEGCDRVVEHRPCVQCGARAERIYRRQQGEYQTGEDYSPRGFEPETIQLMREAGILKEAV